MEDLNLKPGHTYLLRYGSGDTVHEVKVLLVTDKAYQLKWQSGTISWEMKRRMDSDYTVVEDITMVANDLSYDWFKTNLPEFKVKIPNFYVEELCDICAGTGQVQSFETTAGTKTCPTCHGSGKKSKKVTLSFD